MKGLTPVLLIALSIGIFIFYINPEYERIDTLQAEKERYDDAIEASIRLEQLRDNLLATYNSFSTADLRRIEKFLPEQVDDVRLILEVAGIAEDSGISIETIFLSEEDQSEVVASEAPTLVEETEAQFETLTLNFTFQATYGQFSDFIADLETSLRIIDITALDFAAIEESPTTYNFDITLQTYWLK